MEFVKDEIYNIKYTDERCKKENKFVRFISNNKILFSMLIIGLAVCTVNCVLIYNFIKVIENM